jgi:hypothetical protein
MKTVEEFEAFVEAYAKCMGYVDRKDVEVIVLMLSMGYDEEVIYKRFPEAQSVFDAYYLWGEGRKFTKGEMK